VDLIYLDPACARLPSGRAGRPPFNSSATYNVLFKEKSGEESAAQIMAFEDTWGWGLEPEAVYKQIVTNGPPSNNAPGGANPHWKVANGNRQ
jgi:hypothetical protein